MRASFPMSIPSQIGLVTVLVACGTFAHAGQRLDSTTIPNYADPLVIPPAMPRTSVITMPAKKKIDYYEIAVRQFQQHILPASP